MVTRAEVLKGQRLYTGQDTAGWPGLQDMLHAGGSEAWYELLRHELRHTSYLQQLCAPALTCDAGTAPLM